MMHLMHMVYRLFVICGYWRPPSWSTSLQKFAYTVYYLYVFSLMYIVTFCQFMDILLNVETQDEFSEAFYLLVTMLVACYKMYTMLHSRGKIIVIMNILKSEPFQPESKEEFRIRDKYIKQIETYVTYYVILVELSAVFFLFGGLISAETGKLPYRIWQPYNYTSLLAYIFIYVQQVISFIIGSLMHVTCDCLICGLLIHTYSQIEILGCRLKMIKQNDNKATEMCVRCHELVYRFATMINEEFKMAIFVQFTMSTLVICFSLYVLTGTETTGAKLLQVLVFTACMFTQIYILCWYGNEVKLKSLDIPNSIFGLDWTPLCKNTKRDLLMIMMRATFPIEFTSTHVVTMNLDSFAALLKTSYSAYNVLQQGKG